MLEGDFYPDGNDSNAQLHYEIVSWTDSSGTQYEGEIDPSEFPYVEFAIIQVTGEGKEGYTTVYGPWDSEDFVEDILEYDFGKDGSPILK